MLIPQRFRIGLRGQKWQRMLKERAEVEGDGSETRAEGSSHSCLCCPPSPNKGLRCSKKPAPLPWLIFLHLPFSPLCPGLNPPANSKEQAGMIWEVSTGQPPHPLHPPAPMLPNSASPGLPGHGAKPLWLPSAQGFGFC